MKAVILRALRFISMLRCVFRGDFPILYCPDANYIRAACYPRREELFSRLNLL